MRNALCVGLRLLIFLGAASVIIASVPPMSTFHPIRDNAPAITASGGHCKGARWSFDPWISANV